MPWLIPALIVTGVLETVAIQGTMTIGVHLELTLVVVVGWAVLRGWEEGLLAGVVGGFIVDVLSAAPFGVNSIRLGLIGLAAGLVVSRFAHGSVLIPVAAALSASLVGFVLSVLALQASGLMVPWERSLVVDELPSALISAGMMAVGFPVLRALAERGTTGDETADV